MVEADKFLDRQSKLTEFVCLMCGYTFEFSTDRYIKVLDALKVDYSQRLKI